MGRKLTAIFFALWLLLTMPMMASAQAFDPNRMGSISVTLLDPTDKTPIAGAELSLYHVATVSLNSNNNLSYNVTDAFQDCGCALDDPALSAKLDAFVQAHSVASETQVTDARGTAVFSNLALGLYWVKQTNTVADYAPCTPFLVSVPNDHAGGYVYDVDASPKTDLAKLTNIAVRKVWNAGTSADAANPVTVQLLKDGVVVETATLGPQNQWQVIYEDMPESDAYSIREINIPKGFTATYSRSGYVFTVTNSASLAQTGQLIWPIPVLAMTGVCLIAVGIAVLRKMRDRNG